MNEYETTLAEPDILPVLQSKEETRAFYNKIAKVYDLLAEHSEHPMRQAGLKKLRPRRGEEILEIGFGTGHTLVQLAWAVGPAGRVYGIDIAERMAAVARKRLEDEKVADWVELYRGDAEQLPYADESMDAVVMNFTLELFDTPDIPRVLAECVRVLRPGGRIVVVGVSKEGKRGMILAAFEWTHRHFPNLMDCRPIYVRRALEEAGFRIEDASLEHMWVPVEIVLGVKP